MAFRPKPDMEARHQFIRCSSQLLATYAHPYFMSSLRRNILYFLATELCSTPIRVVEYQYSWIK